MVNIIPLVRIYNASCSFFLIKYIKNNYLQYDKVQSSKDFHRKVSLDKATSLCNTILAVSPITNESQIPPPLTEKLDTCIIKSFSASKF